MTKRVKKISTYYDEPFQSECSLDKDLELHLANEKKEKEHLNADVENYMYITRVEKR